MTDSSWYERGELPPVGLECESRLASGNYESGELVYASESIIVWKPNNGIDYASRPKDRLFRPLKSDRDKVIDAVHDAVGHLDNDYARGLVGRIYDAGLLKLPEQK